MTGTPGHPPERRRHRRSAAQNVRVRLVSGDHDDPSSGVNFARRLLNVGLGGMCVETTGRLRAGVTMSAELRFDDFGGALRAKAQLLWVDTLKEGAAETHVAGIRFIGPELTSSVREFLEGGRASMIVNRRKAEYEVLKQQSEERKAGVARTGWSGTAKIAATLLGLALVYLGGFVGAVHAGRREAPGPGIHFRYTGGGSKGGALEEGLATLYSPLYTVVRKAGLDLTYDSP